MFLDLAKAVTIQLMKSGISEQHIEVSGECTFALKDKYYSYRRDKPENLETMIAFMGMHGDN